MVKTRNRTDDDSDSQENQKEKVKTFQNGHIDKRKRSRQDSTDDSDEDYVAYHRGGSLKKRLKQENDCTTRKNLRRKVPHQLTPYYSTRSISLVPDKSARPRNEGGKKNAGEDVDDGDDHEDLENSDDEDDDDYYDENENSGDDDNEDDENIKYANENSTSDSLPYKKSSNDKDSKNRNKKLEKYPSKIAAVEPSNLAITRFKHSLKIKLNQMKDVKKNTNVNKTSSLTSVENSKYSFRHRNAGDESTGSKTGSKTGSNNTIKSAGKVQKSSTQESNDDSFTVNSVNLSNLMSDTEDEDYSRSNKLGKSRKKSISDDDLIIDKVVYENSKADVSGKNISGRRSSGRIISVDFTGNNDIEAGDNTEHSVDDNTDSNHANSCGDDGGLKKVDEIDMYTRVKRERKKVKRDMYGIPIHENDDDDRQISGRRRSSRVRFKCNKNSSRESEENDDHHKNEEDEDEEEGGDDDDEDETEDSSDDDDDEDTSSGRRAYNLRQHRKTTDYYRHPNLVEEQTTFEPSISKAYKSPKKQKKKKDRRRMVMQSSSSNSSSSSEDTDTTGDGIEKFENKRMKKLNKIRQKFLPMNLKVEDIMTSAFKDRAHVGSSMADVEPMNVDTSVTFKDVGGLDKILFSLKEMVILPLIYPEFFKSFKVNAPKGVLFYGPPGTGKTLVARALANEYSRGKSKIAFFMRKGADCLSKWVGESEKQLRILFDQAYQMRPSIIFFDEIDGLAPVRSSKQEQFHNSIVTTLLALMDGLDDRGEVIVIGSTNRIDSIDLAFRRPGRFDRELWFPLPSYEGRRDILKIYTSDWTPNLSDDVLHYLASNTIGYSGADLKYLCSEAALNALHGTYPQIFSTGDKLLIDTKEIQVSPKDFLTAMKTIVPSCDRSITPFAKMLPPFLKPLIGRQLQELSRQVTEKIFPKEKIKGLLSKFSRGPGATNEFEEVFDCDLPDINSRHSALVSLKSNSLLVCGRAGQGHTKYICPALLHLFDNLPVHVINLPALYGNEFKTPEESLVHIIKECKLHTPSILYLPNINHWWKEVSRSVLSILVSMVDELYHTVPVFVLGSCDVIDYDDHDPVPDVILNLFNHKREISTPTEEDREAFFQDLIFSIFDQPRIIKPSNRRRAKTSVPLLTAPPVELRKLSSLELEKLKVMEEKTLRELRLFLRDVINKLSRDRKFAIFSKPVDEDEVPDYYNIIHRPMDLSTMMSKIDLHKYHTVGHFLEDIDLIVSNALEYNPETDEADRSIRHRACALKDTAYWIIDSRLDEDFDKLCKDIYISKINRGDNLDESSKAPKFYFTKPPGDSLKNVESAANVRNNSSKCKKNKKLECDAAVSHDDHSNEASGGNLVACCSDNSMQVDDTESRKKQVRTANHKKLNTNDDDKNASNNSRHRRSKISPWCKSSKRRRSHKKDALLPTNRHHGHREDVSSSVRAKKNESRINSKSGKDVKPATTNNLNCNKDEDDDGNVEDVSSDDDDDENNTNDNNDDVELDSDECDNTGDEQKTEQCIQLKKRSKTDSGKSTKSPSNCLNGEHVDKKTARDDGDEEEGDDKEDQTMEQEEVLSNGDHNGDDDAKEKNDDRGNVVSLVDAVCQVDDNDIEDEDVQLECKNVSNKNNNNNKTTKNQDGERNDDDEKMDGELEDGDKVDNSEDASDSQLPNVIHVEEYRLHTILTDIVMLTHQKNVEELVSLYNEVAEKIFEYRNSLDQTKLVEELELLCKLTL